MGVAQVVDPFFGAQGEDVCPETEEPLVQFIGRVDIDGIAGPSRGGGRMLDVALRRVDGLAVEIVGQQRGRGPPELPDAS